MEDLNYFVCTLGQAAILNAHNPHESETVSDFVDSMADEHDSMPAIGVPIPGDEDPWQADFCSMYARSAFPSIKCNSSRSFWSSSKKVCRNGRCFGKAVASIS